MRKQRRSFAIWAILGNGVAFAILKATEDKVRNANFPDIDFSF